LHAFEQKGYRFDAGPSLFTMPHLVDELFNLFDLDPKEHFNYIRKEVICNYFWEDGTYFSAKADMDQFIEDASEKFETAPQTLRQYLRRNREKYDKTVDIFIEKSLHRWQTYWSKKTLKSLLSMSRLHINSSMDDINTRTFSNKKLIQLFNRYATYNGSSPYKTPGIMTMIPHLEMHYGTFFPKKGMHAISQSLYQLGEAQGIKYHFNSPVEKILHQNGTATGVLVNGKQLTADIVVSNMDIFSTYNKLLSDVKGPKKTLSQERSSSALIFYWGINRQFPELDLHNILFSEQYREEFKSLFEDLTLIDDPTVYIHISSKDKPDDAPKGGENWFVMINTPGNFGQDWEALKAKARKNIIDKINRILNVNIEEHIETEAILDPQLIERNTSSHRGSLYGASSNSKFAAFLRHPNFSGQLKQLYFCGGSVHPGGGIPLCLNSAKIVSNLIPEA
jgi:phytoene desaturase